MKGLLGVIFSFVLLFAGCCGPLQGCIVQDVVPCCGNGVCETDKGETYVTCSSDCKAKLKIDVEGCKNSFDVSHGLGWVADVYVSVKNIGDADATGVSVSATSPEADGGSHPDQQRFVGDLPAKTQVLVKLTIDTAAERRDLAVNVVGTSNEGSKTTSGSPSCGQIDEALIEKVGKILPYLAG